MDAFANQVGAVLHLQQLPAFLPTILLSVLAFTLVQFLLGPLTWRLLGKDREWAERIARDPSPSLHRKKRKEEHNWSTHVTSLAHSLLILPLSFSHLHLPALAADRAFAWDDAAGHVYAIACGYFLWDALDSVVFFQDISFVVHGLSCLAIYGMAFKPFLAYYGVRFLLWELSTPFLNIHYFLDKLALSGSPLQLLNGACLLASFFGARLVYGGAMSYEFFGTLQEAAPVLPTAYIVVYGVGNVVLNVLNWVWFFKMISALRKRFQTPADAPSNGVANGVEVPKLQNGAAKARKVD
ncbi:hypothetical protein NEOLEDRAFT_1241024 [Neolentinus lepideus HHB14362 ss-1]|uniref:TLC domain-containing protein n=1 Tax=Neolentinus lepideus HHB14362 ss-1 TaxID=1314782 RepID=A0A165TEZ8_9AGAM|nr:hypothetical protein NEOLEDRAFT_1241024 [Neolentinus lepideus HHB14362 ss-1]